MVAVGTLLRSDSPVSLSNFERVSVLAAIVGLDADVTTSSVNELARDARWSVTRVSSALGALARRDQLYRLDRGRYAIGPNGHEAALTIAVGNSLHGAEVLLSQEDIARGAPTVILPTDLEDAFDSRLFHSEVVRSARALFVTAFLSESIRKATQHFNNRVKKIVGGEDLDGQALMGVAFAKPDKQPLLAFNDLESLSDRDAHNGYRLMTMGAISFLRNPRSHETEEELDQEPVATLEWLGAISAMHRVLDEAELIVTP